MSGLTTDASTFLAGGALFMLAVFLYNRTPRRPENYPPGPRGVPLYGNLLEVRRCDSRGPGILDKWAREFGDVFSISFGAYHGVVLNSADVVKEVFIKNAHKSSGRSTNIFFFKLFLPGNIGIIFNEGPDCVQSRKKALHSMRDVGLGKTSMELMVQEEASSLVELISKEGDAPFDPQIMLFNAFSNIITTIVFGNRFEHDDPEFTYFSSLLIRVFSDGNFTSPELYIPILTPILPVINPGLVKAAIAHNKLKNFLQKKVAKRKADFDPDHICSFIDVFLKAELDEELQDEHSNENMFQTILDIFAAGAETTATTIRWTLLYLINHPQVQTKCQQEINEVLGLVRSPAQTDKPRLPFTLATIYEVQRMANVAPYGGIHRAEATIEVSGYTIPKDTLLVPNLHHMHMDPEQWGDPENFRPERWIDDDGRIARHESFLPFSLGPRKCLGKSLAMQSMFITLVTLLQKFTFYAKDTENLPKISGKLLMLHVPDDFEIKVSKV